MMIDQKLILGEISLAKKRPRDGVVAKHCKKRKSYNVTLDSIYDKCND